MNESVVAKVRKDTEKVVHNGSVNETGLVVFEFFTNEKYNEITNAIEKAESEPLQ